jgi:heptosyltransferase II
MKPPRSILLLKPCCLGDVIMATALLAALRRAYPDAAIDWAVSSAALGAIKAHPSLRHVIDLGAHANPARHPASLWRLIHVLRAGRYDLLVVPDRSVLLSAAAALSGIPQRAGLDSAGRGFGYTHRAAISPTERRHEAEIYLAVARRLGLATHECWASVPPAPAALSEAHALLVQHALSPQRFVMVHPGGGINAGMSMTEKRWPAERFAALAERIARHHEARLVIVGAASDAPALGKLKAALALPYVDLSQQLGLAATAALSTQAALYLANDNGVGHLAAASGGKVLMIFGPSDPRRYAPFVPPHRARAVWRHVDLPAQGVSARAPLDFSWERDGLSVDEAWVAAQALLEGSRA